MGIKITLGQVRAEDRHSYLLIYCASTPAQAGGCHHSATMSLAKAITLWGVDMHLDDLPLRCSKCGSRKVDVRSDYPKGAGGKPIFTD